MNIYLKVKIKTLAAEAQIIRKEERRVLGSHRWLLQHQGDAQQIESSGREYHGLHHHRVIAVRDEARAALLAYGYIRGRAYRRIENKGSIPKAVFKRVTDMVLKYGGGSTDRVQIIADLIKWSVVPEVEVQAA